MVSNIYKNNLKPDSIALKYKGQDITYAQLDTYVQKYASYFAGMGIKKGDRVILSCLNSAEFIYSYLGIVKTGATVVPINILLTIDEITYVIANSEAAAIIMHPAALAKLKLSKEQVEEALKREIKLLNEELKSSIDSTPIIEFEDFNDESMVSTFLYTSGTTGKPKAAMLTHKNLVSNAEQFSKTIKVTGDDNFICVLPMFHVFGFTVCVLVPLLNGATITILEIFQPKEVVEAMSHSDVTVFTGVPSMYVVLLEAIRSNITFPNLRLAISGGASLPVEIFNQVRNNLKIPLLEGYGLTESSPVVTFNTIEGKQKPGSIGEPIYGVEVKIVDDNGNEVPAGVVGELITKGDNIMLGYFNDEEKTKETLKDGWLYTGDLAKKDEDGYIFIVDRKKDLIIVCGLNVYPREVEEVIYAYSKVKEAAVVGIGDDLRGEYVKAFVVLKEGEECTSKELLRYLRQHIAVYKMPREVEFISELPKNSTGKIQKRALK